MTETVSKLLSSLNSVIIEVFWGLVMPLKIDIRLLCNVTYSMQYS